MVRQRRIRGAAALVASLGAFALCTTASTPPQTGGAQAPAPAAAPAPDPAAAPVPAGHGGGTAAPAPEAGPPAPALEATNTQDVPLEEENEDFHLDVPTDPEPKRKAPKVPALRPMGGVAGTSAGSGPRLAQTGADARLLGAAGTFLIGVGLAMLAFTLPVRRL